MDNLLLTQTRIVSKQANNPWLNVGQKLTKCRPDYVLFRRLWDQQEKLFHLSAPQAANNHRLSFCRMDLLRFFFRYRCTQYGLFSAWVTPFWPSYPGCLFNPVRSSFQPFGYRQITVIFRHYMTLCRLSRNIIFNGISINSNVRSDLCLIIILI